MDTSNQFAGILLAAKALGLPAALAGMTLTCTALARAGGRGGRALATAAAPLALTLAFLGGYAAVNFEHWRMPPEQAWDWLPPLMLTALLAFAALEWRGAGRGAWSAAQAAVALPGVWLMLPPALREQGAAIAAAWTAGLALPWFAAARALDAPPDQRLCVAAALAAASGGLGLVVALGGSVVIGCGAFTLMGALAGCMVSALDSKAAPPPRAVNALACTAFGAILLAAYFYAEISPWLLAAIAISPCAALLPGRVLAGAPARPWRAIAAGTLAAAPPLLGATGFAVWSHLHQASAYGY
ncbi:hypothetical protein [Pseudoduganella namucuonensis]|uniref:Uncharacterized protein n=1 Tax=Pseudoduganella namucuonensis TaxID=1035707 RepID=A0A1I7L740_9BURK|nr:hypothetical protein [Pseudoduganella namucuonensis]SFV05557.1 hypothetical protein SAMN05216552_102425 [Pseudoduganella namucuonensis]